MSPACRLRLALGSRRRGKQLARLVELPLSANDGLLLGVILRRVLEANQIVGGALEGNLKHGPFEANVQTRGAMLMRRGLC